MNRAAIYRRNRTFEVVELAAKMPSKDEVAITVANCGICGTDMHVLHGDMDARMGMERIICHEMSGTIAELDV